MNRLSEGYKRAVDQNWGRRAKIGFFGQKPRFRVQKKLTSLPQPCSGHDRKKLFKEKNYLYPNKYQSLKKLMHFQPKKTLFGFSTGRKSDFKDSAK